MKKILLLFFIPMSLTGCKTVKLVPVPEYHTLYEARVDTVQLRDSIYFRDSMFIAAKGDTVYLIKIHWRERSRNVCHVKANTVVQLDSIRVPYPVEKQFARWQRWKTNAGGWAMGAVAVLAILVILKATKTVHKIA